MPFLTPLALMLATLGGDPPAPAPTPHWGYDGEHGADHWADVDPGYAACKAGRMQSPVDLGESNAVGTIEIATRYMPGPLTLLNNGHTVQANFAAGSAMTSGGREFALIQVHFHTPSEHTVTGAHYPLAAHFVHADAAGALAVLGVFFKTGAANDELEKVIAAAPAQATPAAVVPGATLDPNGMIPDDPTVIRYMGSLTTPPCSEGVNWHIANQTMTASASQIARIHAIMGDNARPVQPLNHRLLVRP